eukprot:s380_g12.t1
MAMRRPHGKAKAKAKMGVDDNPMDPEELKQVFQKIDLDGSGTVEMEETLGIRCSKNSLKKVFKLIDTDGSGSIDFEEFSIFFARARGLLRQLDLKEVLSEASAAFLDYRNSVEQDPSFAKHFPMPPSMNSVVKYSRHFNSTVESVRWVGDGTYLGATGEGKASRSFVE